MSKCCNILWAGSERTARYHVEVLQRFMGCQWTDSTIPCRSAATFYELAVNGWHGTMSTCCNVLWAGSELMARYHVEVLQHFMGWQWMDSTIPCRSAATFYGLAVNGQYDTMSKCCNILWAGSERMAQYHVEVLQHFIGWQWTDNTVPCWHVATFHSQFLCYTKCPKGHVTSTALHLIARSLAGPDFKPAVATALNCV